MGWDQRERLKIRKAELQENSFRGGSSSSRGPSKGGNEYWQCFGIRIPTLFLLLAGYLKGGGSLIWILVMSYPDRQGKPRAKPHVGCRSFSA